MMHVNSSASWLPGGTPAAASRWYLPPSRVRRFASDRTVTMMIDAAEGADECKWFFLSAIERLRERVRAAGYDTQRTRADAAEAECDRLRAEVAALAAIVRATAECVPLDYLTEPAVVPARAWAAATGGAE